jgi:polyhydroxyalkanoate synthesis regulator phasin
MRDALKAYLALASGVTELTRQRAVAAAKALVSQGEATAEQVGGLAEDLLAQTKYNREAVRSLVTYEVDRTLGRVGLASAEEVAQLTERVRALEAQLGAASKAPASKAPVKKTPVKKNPVKKNPVKKTPVKNTPVKNTPVKNTPVKKTAPAGSAPGGA